MRRWPPRRGGPGAGDHRDATRPAHAALLHHVSRLGSVRTCENGKIVLLAADLIFHLAFLAKEVLDICTTWQMTLLPRHNIFVRKPPATRAQESLRWLDGTGIHGNK